MEISNIDLQISSNNNCLHREWLHRHNHLLFYAMLMDVSFSCSLWLVVMQHFNRFIWFALRHQFFFFYFATLLPVWLACNAFRSLKVEKYIFLCWIGKQLTVAIIFFLRSYTKRQVLLSFLIKRGLIASSLGLKRNGRS